MLFTLGHGQQATLGARVAIGAAALATEERPDLVRYEEVVPDAGADGPGGVAAAGLAAAATIGATESAPEPDGLFGYLFTDVAEAPTDPGMTDRLDALAEAMIEQPGAGGDSAIAPVLTYFGQFIDHDITAGTDTDDRHQALRIDVAAVAPQNRSFVVVALKNARLGSLGLDSVYGDGPIRSPATIRVERAMRTRDGIRMRTGGVVDVGSSPPLARPPLPVDSCGDLPRVGTIVGQGILRPDELPEPLRFDPVKNPHWTRKALIGDARNDENLIVAQLHLAFLRFHNAIADSLGAAATFEEAQRLTRWHYQWLVVNVYLRSLCDPDTLELVERERAPIYRRFLATRPLPRSGSLPIPLEFSAAGFRFGHSMVRAGYDFNLNFPGATFRQLFEFTGRERTNPIGGPGVGGHPTLPHNWIIQWDRFLGGGSSRNARKIDTHIALPLSDMINEADATTVAGLFKFLARRNLRRGHVLNLPTAQALIGRIETGGFGVIAALTPAEVRGTLDAGLMAPFEEATPLWFYILREAEVVHDGERLGPLGSRIVAETLFGLIAADPGSYLNRHGSPWSPAEAARSSFGPIDSFEALFRASGLL